MRILAIETSCDDTAAAILTAEFPISVNSAELQGAQATGLYFQFPNYKVKILSNVVSSQVELHAKYGGVFPSLAKREHQRNLVPVLKQALKEAGLLNEKLKMKPFDSAQGGNEKPQSKIKKVNDILIREELLFKQTNKFLTRYSKPKVDAIAVTVGPGLEPCLWVGVNFAKALAYYWDLPIIPVNHIESHILANFLAEKSDREQFSITNCPQPWPAIALIVSGGHTQLVFIEKLGQYKILGETRDDAAGECFDKTARLLGLPYPGGPSVAAAAAKFPISPPHRRAGNFQFPNNKEKLFSDFKIKLPRPMMYSKDYDFSFSGLKTAVLYQIRKDGAKAKNKNYVRQMCYEIQQSIIDVLITKTIKAARDYRVKTIMLGGGVAANEELRGQFKVSAQSADRQDSKLKVNLYIPPKNLCTDNAAMTAMAGYLHLKERTMDWEGIEARANFHL